MMDREDLIDKLAQIEEQATYTLAEFPLSLTKARLKMILALARYLRTEISLSESSSALPEPMRHASENDDANARSA